MPVFQCVKCGGVENTATSFYWTEMCCIVGAEQKVDPNDKHLVKLQQEDQIRLAKWRKVMGLLPNDPFGPYCSMCSPVWFNGDEYGEGAPPVRTWHGKFPRKFLPKGKYPNKFGSDLRHIKTGEPPEVYLDKEQGT